MTPLREDASQGGGGPITVEMVAAAAIRAEAQGEDLKRRTAHYVAQHLVLWDPECRGRDYGGAVSAARLWLKGCEQ